MPEMSGKVISITTTCGESSCAIAMAWLPVLASPTMTMSVWLSSSIRRPVRTTS